jgi:CheY-like chemotaxis protein
MTLVLVVEDDPAVRSRVAETLAEKGYAVRTAPDGRSALSTVEEERPDAVVSESIMPGLDGWSLAARLRMRAEPIPVVLMSSFGVVPPVPSVRVLPHPVAPAELCAAVADAIA